MLFGTAESRIVLICADDKLPNLPCLSAIGGLAGLGI